VGQHDPGAGLGEGRLTRPEDRPGEGPEQGRGRPDGQGKIPTNDLFALLIEKPDCFSNDGVHLNAKGSAAMGEQVAAEVLKLLNDDKK
jgi:hypothetical protein